MNPLYRSNSQLQETETVIQSVRLTDDGRTALVLRDLIFFPNGGGQPNDHGTVMLRGESFTVTALEKVPGDVLVVLDRKADFHDELAKKEPVLCALDWDRRLKIMRMHTAQHALAAVLRRQLTGFVTHGMDIPESAETCVMQFSADQPPDSVAATLAHQAEVARNPAVLVQSFPSLDDAKAAAGSLFRMNPGIELKGTIRLITIEGLDANPCGGTHVLSLGEIGKLSPFIFKELGEGRYSCTFFAL